MVFILLGPQESYEEYSCSLCLWESRADNRHFLRKDWPTRSTLTLGTCNVKSSSLVDPKNILHSPLHFKHDLTKHLVKALNKDNPSFKFLQREFPAVSDAEFGAGMFNGPQIRELMKSCTFDEVLSKAEKTAWISFKNVSTEFFEKNT